MNSRRESLVTYGLVAIIALGCLWVFWGQNQLDTASSSAPSPVSTVSDSETGDVEFSAATDDSSSQPRFDGPIIDVSELPPEAIDTLLLIDANGPYPYSKDGSTFQNREGRLPDHDQGYYAEFTVETPGSRDRGARRIVAGDDGELWYTDDHYDSFREIVGW